MEILVALLIISIGMVSITGLLTSTLGAGSRARNDLHMVSFADMVLNQLHSEEWSTLQAAQISIKDYNGTALNITPGVQRQYSAAVIGKDGQARDRYTVTYQLDLNPGTDRIEAVLRIWPGFAASGNPSVFHTEFYNWRKTP